MIVTFYSYKGGVGRSFCLVNIGALLTQWGYRVLCVDWDLDAPGLNHYFQPLTDVDLTDRPGVVDLIHEFARGEDPDWSASATRIHLTSGSRPLSLITAGRRPDESYDEHVQSIDWARLYAEKDLGRHLDDLRLKWQGEYDFVLVDSRTGVTDIGGICTAQLPDLLAVCFVANQQSLLGAFSVARRAALARNALPYDRFRILTLPLLSRLDSREEYKLAEEWRTKVANTMREFYDQWVPKTLSPLDLIERTAVPYVPIWSYGEQIPAAHERTSNPDLVSYTFETIAALIARRLTSADQLIHSRDEYVRKAHRRANKLATSDRPTSPREPRSTELVEDPYDGSHAPVFFVSYARARRPSRALPADVNQNVLRFFRDLTTFVNELVALPPGRDAGIMDMTMDGSALWQQEMLRAAGTCQVFISLLSTPYLVQSEWTAMEWDLFARRKRVRRDGKPTSESGIVPLLWTPIDGPIPPVVQSIPRFTPTDLPDSEVEQVYRDNGLFGLFSLGLEQAYQAIVWRVAMRVQRMFASYYVEPNIPADTAGLHRSFVRVGDNS